MVPRPQIAENNKKVAFPTSGLEFVNNKEYRGTRVATGINAPKSKLIKNILQNLLKDDGSGTETK